LADSFMELDLTCCPHEKKVPFYACSYSSVVSCP
jgi:hypothetical protein